MLVEFSKKFQELIKNPIKYLRWSFLGENNLPFLPFNYFHEQGRPSLVFDSVLNMVLYPNMALYMHTSTFVQTGNIHRS